jgi:carbonic anhydrase/acetyltransferase-like protein (isoleucine patch superfamily)
MTAIMKAADGFVPEISSDVFLADSATLVGNVRLGRGTSIWFGAVLRGDAGAIRIGSDSAIQDGCILRASRELSLEIGDSASVGEGTVLRGAKVGHGVLIGPGCIIMEEVHIGDSCIIAAGTLIPRGTRIPENSFVRGRPAKVLRTLTEDELHAGKHSAKEQARLARLQQSTEASSSTNSLGVKPI